MKKVSIIVPVYNREKTIKKCLDSLVNQTYTNIEILVINNNSTDETVNIVRKLAKENAKIQLFNCKEQGVSYSRNCGIKKATGGYLMFVVGLLVNYFVIFPLTVRFLGTYQVSENVENMLTLHSYIGTLLTMSLVFGALFEIPVVCWLLALFGLLRPEWMRHYRRHSIMVILVLAAIVTPTTDVFTLLIVSLPIWLLYEVSIWVVAVTAKKKVEKEKNT